MFIIEKQEHKKLPYYFLRRAVQNLVTFNSKYIAENAKKIENRGGREKLKKKMCSYRTKMRDNATVATYMYLSLTRARF